MGESENGDNSQRSVPPLPAMSFHNEAVFEKESDAQIEEGQLSDADTTDETTIASLTLDDSDKNIASLPLTGGNGVVVRSYAKSPHYLPLAVIAFVVNLLFGLPAVVCACLSRRRRHEGDEEAAQRLGKVAFWLSIVGIAISLVVGVFVIVYIYVIIPNIIKLDFGGIT
ncbi:trafficking regulator of GLUT4 1-like [Littorina saxatilis]|uniref:trafficking regulator of GLUT4 1-like n=1 Tax=Littorina saxatilis TaxID=31220 RepID=UPI0038B4BD6D